MLNTEPLWSFDGEGIVKSRFFTKTNTGLNYGNSYKK